VTEDAYQVELVSGIADVPALQWNRLSANATPFVSHEYLLALERNGCVGGDSGWKPRHLLVRRGTRLVAAMPLYLKFHSQGEFVFDWGWAEAYERSALAYYPKLVSAVPFTPTTGPRLLVDPDPDLDGDALRRVLIAAGVKVAARTGVSSWHCLFPPSEQAALFADAGLLTRTGCQFHWLNPGYRDFEDYLDAMSSKRRKQIRRERREAARAPVEIELRSGAEMGLDEWRAYHRLYASTYDRKWGYPSLSLDFFVEIGRTLADQVLVVLARNGNRYVAGAHCFVDGAALYGRNWGCSEFHRALHFEMCYYRTIEYCIRHRLARFDAGAQGEHKLLRGFIPVRTWSGHWIADQRMRAAIARFLDAERESIDAYLHDAAAHLPFKAGRSPAPGGDSDWRAQALG